jgi:hypothetical protein
MAFGKGAFAWGACNRGANSSGSLAMFTAILRASSRVSKWLESRPSFFNDRYAAARPITAPFFFESKTTGLMFVRNCCPQSFHGQLFCWFPREDAAADYPCKHGGKKHPKLCLLHRGVLRSPTPLRTIINSPTYQVLRNSSGSLAIFAAIRRALPSAV